MLGVGLLIVAGNPLKQLRNLAHRQVESEEFSQVEYTWVRSHKATDESRAGAWDPKLQIIHSFSLVPWLNRWSHANDRVTGPERHLLVQYMWHSWAESNLRRRGRQI